MKHILITGANSYIGTSVEKWLKKVPQKYSIHTLDMQDENWREKDFSPYDVVFHVAGIAHVSTDPKKEDLYYRINRDLTIETAKKAKKEGVKQFIFMSSIIVYGKSNTNETFIDRTTVPNPTNFYGKSKLQAEEGLRQIEDNSFKIVVLRPPMIYGKGSKGNYPKLSKAAQRLPFFPDFENKRSMLHIDNLCEFIKLMIDNEERGLFFPQNREYVRTSEMVKMIAEIHGKDIRLTKFFNPILKTMVVNNSIINKAFGNLFYDQKISSYKPNYRVRDFKESIQLTETGLNDE